MKTLTYPTQSEIVKRNQLHTEIRCMAHFIRKTLCSSSEVKNGHIQLRQGDWFQFQGQSLHTNEFLTKFYCCRNVERSKMPDPREWQLDLCAAPRFPVHFLSAIDVLVLQAWQWHVRAIRWTAVQRLHRVSKTICSGAV
jgi:hypothetical protein